MQTEKKPHFPSIFKEVFQPRCVTHSLFCNFINPNFKSLVLIGSTHLDVYDLVKTQSELRFDHAYEINFNQEVIDAVNVKYYGNTLDSIILAFDEAKFSVISFDALSYEVKTIALHFYEFEFLKKNRTDRRKYPIIRVDPEKRCAVALVYDDSLGIIPFRNSQNMMTSSLDGNLNKTRTCKMIPSSIPLDRVTQHDLFSSHGLLGMDRPTPNLSTYVANLHKLPGVKIGTIEDMQFLHGYYEPTLMILYDPVGTFIGQSLFRKDTMCMMALSLNLQKRTNPIIWHMKNLPVDCFKILPVPRPIGGVIILQPNIMIYLNQSQPSCGFALNGYAKKTNFPLRHIKFIKPFEIDDSVSSFINSDQIIIISKYGNVLIASLILEPVMRTVVGIKIEKCFKTVVPYCISVLSENYIFVGSVITNSVLLRYEPKESEAELWVTSDISNEPLVTLENKINQFLTDDEKPEEENNEPMVVTETLPIVQKQKQTIHYEFCQVDLLKNLGPIRYMTVCETNNYTKNFQDPHSMRLMNELTYIELMAVTGNGECGCISFINFTMKPTIFNTFDMDQDFHNMWWVKGGIPTLRIRSEIEHDENLKCIKSDQAIADEGPLNEESEENIFENKDYIIVSKLNMLMLIEVGNNIVEIEKSGFCKTEITVSMGNIGSIYCERTEKRYPLIYQVCGRKFILLNGIERLIEFNFDTEFDIVHGCCVGNFIILRTEENEIFLVRVQEDSINDYHNYSDYVYINKISLEHNENISSFTLYNDAFNFITKGLNPVIEEIEEMDYDNVENNNPVNYLTESLDDIDSFLYSSSGSKSNQNIKPRTCELTEMDIELATKDEEYIEKYLYGDVSDNEPIVQSQQPVDNIVNSTEELFDPESNINPREINPQTYTFILFADGNLDIYTIPEFKLVFRTVNFFDAPNLLLNCLKYPHLSHLQASYENYQAHDDINTNYEIIVCNIGRNKNRPVLFARGFEELIVYEILPPISSRTRYLPDIGDCLRMKRIPMSFIMRPSSRAREDPRLSELHKYHSNRYNLMQPFENIEGFRGLFIAGSYPLWLFFTDDGRINTMIMYLEGLIPAFASNPHISDDSPSFGYLNAKGEMRMCRFPEGYDFNYQKSVRRISFHKTIHFVQYHIESKIWSVISSVDKEVTSMFKLNAENSKEEEVLERENDSIRAKVPEYMLEFYANSSNIKGSWQIVPHACIVFEPWDTVSCMSIVQLNPHSSYAGTKDFLAIGSNMNYGEEIPVRGKIMIVDLVNVVPQPGKPLTQYKVKTVYDCEQKGPITAITSCRGLLVSAVGQKMYIWQLVGNDLVGIAFVDTDSYISGLHVTKDMILAVDLNKPIQVVRFQPELRVLSLVGRGPPTGPKTINTTGNIIFSSIPDFQLSTLVNTSNMAVLGSYFMSFVSCDFKRNIMVLGYDPTDPQSRNGRQLVRWADGRLPVQVFSSLRINDRCRDPLLYTPGYYQVSHDSVKNTIYFGSNLGAIYRFTPITDNQLTEMQLTEKNLSQSVHHYGGLHPKTSSQYKFTRKYLSNTIGNIADGNLLYRYLNLPHSQQIEIGIKAGVKKYELITDHLTEMHLNSIHF